MPNTIRLSFTGVYEEALANAALSPGHLIEKMTTGKVRKHTDEGGRSVKMFAFEDALQGKSVSDAYAADDIVGYGIPNPGDRVLGILKAGENVSKGTKLISAGDGTLIAVASASTATEVDDIVGEAEEALNLSGGGAVDTHIAVRVA